MSGEKGWSQALLIGGGIVAAGGILYYLYSSSSAPRQYDGSDDEALDSNYPNEKAPRQQYDDDDDDDRDEQNEMDELPRQQNDDTSASKPLRNPLPPLPERPAGGKRRTASSSKPSAAASKDESSKDNAKTSSQTQVSKMPEVQSSAAAVNTGREPDSSSNSADASSHDSGADEDNVLDWSETAEEVIILLAVPASAQKHEVDYKLKPTHLTVSVQGVRLIQAKLAHAVQPEDSVWQFDLYQGSRVIAITLQKATSGSGPGDWDKLFLT